MFVGILNITIVISEPFSLKLKRKEMKSIKEKVKNKFNVSIAEVDNLDIKKYGSLSIVNVGNSKDKVNSTLDRIVNFIERIKPGAIAKLGIEIIKF